MLTYSVVQSVLGPIHPQTVPIRTDLADAVNRIQIRGHPMFTVIETGKGGKAQNTANH
ncbi:protein of unknown function [Candidatus Hydrogenisulfobacillus filiaventi]|uniref:Uncharacterized protein n=1 Tax=Candidatus Hydrogenisulfobacillus filiaventi TaxID=2707344 RepID=A0A6F8ZKQ5_9FIRM|nr:protein of unknown function [Candidatus Hydrogenisulfobacillus filiaventi]